MDKITLSVNLVNGILGYLGKRPYEETFQLIQAIQAEGSSQTQPEALEKTEE